ncbi:MAG: T9SS type A sorting domain-containing protein [Bacteroidia bacterium]|nr:T9SS type A sorting domain-containing protein [Bacteroidia bacterium]
MKKILLFLLSTALFGSNLNAQQDLRCHTDEVFQEAVRNNPDLLRIRQQLDAELMSNANRSMHRTNASGAPIYIIPVVFHILHNYGVENISDEQVHDAMRVINEDFNKLNPDTSQILPVFLPIAANAQIEFRLANIDPNGNCTNGIDRIVTNLTYNADDNSKLNPWPNNKYINIWIANTLSRSGAAAYAFLPGTTSSANDGIMGRHNYTGSIGTSTPNNKRTLTHELGHVLGLYHPWGSGEVATTCGDDQVNDTPITQGFTTCQTASSAQICNPPIIENYQNFMDYSYCDVMYTEDQKTRMFNALNSGASGRNNLWTPGNLTATGTDGSPITICTPNADFISNRIEVCAGGTVTFNDISWNGKATSWYWEFQGGSPSTSTDSMPVITYPTPGVYDVMFVSTNSSGTDTISRAGYVYVSDAVAALTAPIFETFDSASSFPGVDGYVLNKDNGQAWSRVTGIAYAGTGSIRINNYTNVPYEIDEYIMPSIDMSNIGTPVTMTFYYANAQRSSTSNDELSVWGSINCGQLWTNRWTRAGAQLATAGVTSISFIPSSTSQWDMATVSMNPYALKPRVRFKFQNISDRGNNTYIDNINITGTIVNVDEIDAIDLGFALYPNPTSSNTTVQFKISKTQPVTIQVTDLTGRLVKTVAEQTLSAGLHEYPVEISTPGIYLIKLMVNNKFHARKLIISGE